MADGFGRRKRPLSAMPLLAGLCKCGDAGPEYGETALLQDFALLRFVGNGVEGCLGDCVHDQARIAKTDAFPCLPGEGAGNKRRRFIEKALALDTHMIGYLAGDLETFDHLIFKGDTANYDETDSQQSGIIGRTIDLLKLMDPTRKKNDARYTRQYKKKRRKKKRKKKKILDLSNAVGIDQMV